MMKKVLSAVILIVLCLLCSAAGFTEADFTEKSVMLITEAGENGELTLRFFSETPNIPYLGISEYSAKILQIPINAEKKEDGTLLLKNDRGGELRCDAAAGILHTPDWVRVITPQMPLEGAPLSLKDSSCAFVRITDVAYEGEAAPTTFDFAKYGIRIYTDDRDAYLPLSVVSNMMTDIATNHLRYDGKNVYQCRIEEAENPEDPILVNESMKVWLAGEDRPEDVIRQCYADLCFNFDYFFGHPGKAVLDAAIAGKGLDQALTDLGEEGAEIKAGLLSSRMADYLAALQKLFLIYLSDGHTFATDLSSLAGNSIVMDDWELTWTLTIDSLGDMLNSRNTRSQILNLAITPQRKLAWEEDFYHEYGNTAIIRLDTFMPDEAAWENWYKGEGTFPADCVGTVVSGLRKAQENADIRNVLFDVSCNGGGSSDVLMMILGLTSGQNQLYGINRLTGQSMLITYETDNNFDGVFDEKDRDTRYDFNYGVLTTRQSFSCANLFPIIFREGGAVVIGEPSGGGSCCIQFGIESQGIRYMMSSCQWQLVDSTGTSVEDGCKVDIPLGTDSFGLLDKLAGRLGFDDGLPILMSYFNDENLDTLMNMWFHVEEELEPAA